MEAVVARCTEVDSGARNVDHILTDTLLPELSRHMLEKMAADIPIATIHARMTPRGFVFEFNTPAVPPASDAGAKAGSATGPKTKASGRQTKAKRKSRVKG